MPATDAGDPARTLALLWRQQSRPRRGPRPTRSVDDVVAAAVALADESGLDALTMRALADRLGASTMSVYTYVPGKPELLDAMLDAIHLAMPRTRWRTRSWRRRVTSVAEANRDLLLAHPWATRLHGLSRPPLGPGTLGKYEHELAAFDGTGLSEIEIDAALTFVVGFAQAQARTQVGLVRPGGPEDTALRSRPVTTPQRCVPADSRLQSAASAPTHAQWWAASAPLLSRLVRAEDYPRATRVGSAAGAAQGAAYDPDRAWEFGLARVLDGLAALIEERARP